MEFPDEQSLRDQVDRDVQELINLRVFQSVRSVISPVTPDNANDGRRDVILLIEDATTFVPIPLPLYDSNAGGLQILYVQIWDNMAGTLTNWFSIASLTLRRDENGRIETGPWLFIPQVSNIRAGSLVFGVKFEQERVESQRYDGPVLLSDYRYDRSALFLNTEFRFGSVEQWRYTIEPGVEFRYAYTDFLGSGGYSETPWGVQALQSFYFDNVDFLFNARRGIRSGMSNTVRLIENDGKVKPATDFSAEFIPYFAFGPRGNITYYPRVSGLMVIGDTYEGLGISMRGIPDTTMDGNWAVFLNQTLGLSLWRWKGVWDLQVHPFFDLGVAGGGTRPVQGWADIRKSAGADILLFIEKVPNLALRFSWGVDLDPDVPWGDDNKTEFIVRYAYTY